VTLGESPQGHGADLGEDDRGGPARIDPDNPSGIGGGHLDEALLDGIVEAVGSDLETVEGELLGALTVLGRRAGR